MTSEKPDFSGLWQQQPLGNESGFMNALSSASQIRFGFKFPGKFGQESISAKGQIQEAIKEGLECLHKSSGNRHLLFGAVHSAES